MRPNKPGKQARYIGIGLGAGLIATVIWAVGLLSVVLMAGALICLGALCHRQRQRTIARDERMSTALRLAIERHLIAGDRIPSVSIPRQCATN